MDDLDDVTLGYDGGRVLGSRHHLTVAFDRHGPLVETQLSDDRTYGHRWVERHRVAIDLELHVDISLLSGPASVTDATPQQTATRGVGRRR